MSDNTLELTVLLPCLNEARTIGACIEQAKTMLASEGFSGEILVSDNGSTDGSQALAASLGARVVAAPVRGYGAALQCGIRAARGRYIVMGDCDMSYDFGQAPRFVAALRQGHELVIGNRFKGGIEDGAMPFLHRYLGNPVLTKLGQVLFSAWEIGDFHCGLRGFSSDSIRSLGLSCTGMEFASEMIVKAKFHNLRTCEVPTVLRPDKRDRSPHLRTWHDGWRHLRFLLACSPRWVFLYPGVLLMLAGLTSMAYLTPGPRIVGNAELDIHTLLFAGVLVLVGAQSVFFALLSKVYLVTHGIQPHQTTANRFFAKIRLEHGLVLGIVLTALGLWGSTLALYRWASVDLGPQDPRATMRLIIPSCVALALGAQTIFSAFFLSLLGLNVDRRGRP